MKKPQATERGIGRVVQRWGEREGQRRIKDEGETTNRCSWQRGEGSRERFTLVPRKKRKESGRSWTATRNP